LGFTGLVLLIIFYVHHVERRKLKSLPKPPESIAELAPLVVLEGAPALTPLIPEKSENEAMDRNWIPNKQLTEDELKPLLQSWKFSLEGGKIVGTRKPGITV
jgi:hypothetical protein